MNYSSRLALKMMPEEESWAAGRGFENFVPKWGKTYPILEVDDTRVHG